MSKITKKIEQYALYGVVFSLVFSAVSMFSALLDSGKSTSKVTKGVQLPSVVPYASADHTSSGDGDACDAPGDGGGPSCW